MKRKRQIRDIVLSQNELYCQKCKSFPQEIIEKYLDPIVEIRKWNGENWELVESNIDGVEYEQFCKGCGTKLLWCYSNNRFFQEIAK